MLIVLGLVVGLVVIAVPAVLAVWWSMRQAPGGPQAAAAAMLPAAAWSHGPIALRDTEGQWQVRHHHNARLLGSLPRGAVDLTLEVANGEAFLTGTYGAGLPQRHVGPLPEDAARALLAKLTQELPRAEAVVPATLELLVQEPHLFEGRMVRVQGDWTRFARGPFLEERLGPHCLVPTQEALALVPMHTTRAVVVTGLFQRASGAGFGMGRAPTQLIAFEVALA